MSKSPDGCRIKSMTEQRSRISELTSGERLRRKGQVQATTRNGTTLVQNLIIVGASAGGYDALIKILRELSTEIPAAIVVLLHMSLDSNYRLKDTLRRFTEIPIVSVENSELLRHGAIFLPPPGKSATFRSGRLIVDRKAAQERQVTTISRLFASAAKAYRKRVIGVILSGLLRDGTDGLRAVHEAGGLTLVQDPADAEYPSMPANAMEDLPVTFCLNLSDMGAALELLVRRRRKFETGLAVAVRTLQTRANLLVRLVQQSWRNQGVHEFLMKELTSLNRDLHSINGLINKTLPRV
jgi:chemotaxis response regulator CheB